jgi:hypothetical protein
LEALKLTIVDGVVVRKWSEMSMEELESANSGYYLSSTGEWLQDDEWFGDDVEVMNASDGTKVEVTDRFYHEMYVKSFM